MKRETTPLMRPLSTPFHKQNPIYVELVVLFLLLGLTIFLFSSRSIDYTSPPLQSQTQTPFPTHFQENHEPLITPNTHDSETERSSPEFDTQDTETDLTIIDQETPSSSTSNESHKEETKPSSTSNESHKGEVKPSSASNESHKEEAKPKCDLFKGEWVPNPNGPAYNNHTCKLIEGQQNCMTNGRPDTGYLYWRWKPSDCELPKFNPETFLNFMRNKTFAFVGDSISRNHFQSLLCILSQVEEPKVIYRDENFRTSTWIFPSYNFTLARVWAPFLLKAETFEDTTGGSSSDIKLHLDKLEDVWTQNYTNYDYIIIAGGQWFLKTAIYYEHDQVQGCHNCPGKNLTELGYDYAYRKAISLIFNFMTSSTHKPQILFRTVTPSHFENGQWHNGGTCKRFMPYKSNEVNVTEADGVMYDVEMEEFDRASKVASEKGISLSLFHGTQLSLLRPDGHPGPYMQYRPFGKDKNAKVQNDCLHWCLPGPIDTWNELVLEMLMNG